jgi:hypothetical protein
VEGKRCSRLKLANDWPEIKIRSKYNNDVAAMADVAL